ncbi:hypothetical protein [Phyllobacterium zundukense]|uniref:Uncharacterized protein n=1 Tax=Phyllobacterium zundukense TaxID=1867719 RepID=A0A2N9W168_9HYPH|nr:hypothetical protein [Phyllobacterium zundukense]ATU94585.1 hypothetical protein BLM14_22640 [Phyllobacterium zundukense]PIO45486.1 hypothetical protein B5P45_07290 [Phyllobacterium zundukense]
MEKQPSEHPVRETGAEARQGPLGRPVLMVLLGGLLLAVIAWGAVEMFGESTDDSATITNQDNTTGGQNMRSDDATPPSGDQPTTNAPVYNDPTPQTGTGGDSQTKNPAGTAP